ncbi:MAG TPA: response regulator [Terriglobales bacterium]|nr:response regulator [Terriglobales bacterium]
MKTILVADDEASIRVLIRTTLENPECRILEAATGAAALSMAGRLLPELIVLDWMMPGISGLDVLRALRNDPRTAAIPVIMVTAMGQERHRAEGLALGAQAYLVKPFSPLELLQLTQQVLEAGGPEESHDDRAQPERDRTAKTA